jgi:hypothetical protein
MELVHPSPATQSEEDSHEQALVDPSIPAEHSAPGPHRGSLPSPVHALHTPAVQTSPGSQSMFAAHAGVQRPPAQDSPVAHCPLPVQVHCEVVCVDVQVAPGPHCVDEVQRPQVPLSQTCPAEQSAFEAQVGHSPGEQGLQTLGGTQIG